MARWPMTLRFGAGIVLLWLGAAIFAPWLTPVDPYAIDLDNVLRPPGGDWLMGTDHVGRDIFTRVIFAARIDIWMGVMGVLAPLLIGVTIGLFAGYFGGVLDSVMMRIVDITLAFPFLILILAIVAMLGPGITNFIIALALVAWVSYARLIRADVMVVKSAEYIQAARTLGFSSPFIIFKQKTAQVATT